MVETIPGIRQGLVCYHCGQACDEQPLWKDDKSFCCYGCKTVYEILRENNLCEYYSLDKTPGVQRKKINEDAYAFLDDAEVEKKLLEFISPSFARVRFFIPAIHCISCIWLLENLHKMNKGVLRSEVNFARKVVSIDFNPEKISLSGIAELIDSIGYTPRINLENETQPEKSNSNKQLITKLGIAGFCFGNVMLLSFPEYLGIDKNDEYFMRIFSWLNVVLSIPVLLYSGVDYFKAAWQSFKQRQINIDVPIAVGLLALFMRSTWDIAFHTGAGYLDSFTGLVFFLLIGRWFQSKTYESLAFDRDFKSYFPLAVQKLTKDQWQPVVIYELKQNDYIRIRNMEIVPADSVLVNEEAFIDYSFVTGESRPVQVSMGDLVYAGGRLIGQPIELVVQKRTTQSHLTSLWNNEIFRKTGESRYKRMSDRVARRFTWIVLVLTVATGVYWHVYEPSRMWLIVTSVLMVACPCALALAAPFTYGTMLRVFGRNGLYLKNADIIERMAVIDAVVFDKTGTITNGSSADVTFNGSLEQEEQGWIRRLTQASAHPLSALITKSIQVTSEEEVVDFIEIPGKGIEGAFHGNVVRVGSPIFVGFYEKLTDPSSKVFVSINGEVRGYFSIGTSLRMQIHDLVSRLGKVCAGLLSGDNESDYGRMKGIFGKQVPLRFNQSPHDKLDFISDLCNEGKHVMMLGDGLNDSGALKQSDVGIAVTDDTGIFTPACDGILHGEKIGLLDSFLALSRSATTIVRTGFVISFFYNVIALTFAISGHLTPLVAAILMPVSSISVVGFSSLAVNYVASQKKYNLC